MPALPKSVIPNPEAGSLSGKNLGAVYTPAALAHWVSAVFVEKAAFASAPTICDPACGDGELLLAVQKHVPRASLLGIDVDPVAITNAKERTSKRKVKFCNSDALIHPSFGNIPSWISLFKAKRIDGIIANPPWGADLDASRDQLSILGYSFATGQFDSWNLFLEAILSNLNGGGTAALIIPDSIFLPEHTRARALLHNTTTIEFIARLGEGFFPEIFRGTAIVIFRKNLPSDNHKVEVIRMNKDDRSALFSGSSGFEEIRARKSHLISQARFRGDQFSRWDIDTSEVENQRIYAYTSKYSDWTDWLCSGRGVELSKFGVVDVCPACNSAHPASKKSQITCASCGYKAQASEFAQTTIVSNEKTGADQLPFLVGEDVGRYFARPSRFIKEEVRGINYKSAEVYNQRRLLIRKTGVGIKAAIVNRKSLTNQVVFHYYENSERSVPSFYLSYCLGVLASRTLLAYHLRTNGDNEWRSHPYVTQKVIKGFPIPVPVFGTATWKQAQAIAALVDRALSDGALTAKADTKIEGLVAALYGFDEASYEWIQSVLGQAELLEPIRALQLSGKSRVIPRWVD